MECVFRTGDFDRLRETLADDLTFRGPMYDFDSADDYVNSLRSDPPVGFHHEVLRTYTDHSSVCLVYRFSKPGVATTMVQTFDIVNEKIQSILLVFDTGVFR